MESDSSTFKYALRLPNSLFAENREKFFKMFKSQVPEHQKSLLLFKGKDDLPIDSTDIDYEVKQESFFYYLFGVQETGCSAAVDIENEKVYMFYPRMDEVYKIWMKVLNEDEIKELYPDFELKYVDELEQWVADFKPEKVYTNNGINSDSGLATVVPDFKWLPQYTVDKDTMHDILSESRVIKSQQEIEILKWANRITSEAHVHTMRQCKPGVRESYLSSKFKAYCQEKYNCKILPYFNICACGPNPSTLHYLVNNDILPEVGMCLMDMGHSVHCYGADVTVCYPTNGKFTEKQAQIHNLVVKANRTVMKNMKPGVAWPDMHLLAERVTLEGLKELGILKEDVDIEEALENRLGFIFQPHGLGHLIGIDTHDVGGYIGGQPLRSSKWGLKNLRTARKLEEGMNITVEPGCYFIPSLLNREIPDLDIDVAKYVNIEKAFEYREEVAGVRIEDCVIVTADGCENLTEVPRTIEQIEACMKGDDWTQLPEFSL
jgi:Xaa-Pro dipeptidase